MKKKMVMLVLVFALLIAVAVPVYAVRFLGRAVLGPMVGLRVLLI